MAHLRPELTGFLEAWLPAVPARVLEVGCGDGALTARLADQGFDVLGIDPKPPNGSRFVATTLERFRPKARFDAAVAIRSLHHLHDPERAVDSLAGALSAGAPVVVFEFAIESIDHVAIRWQRENGIERPLRGDLDDVIPLAELRRALAARFRELSFEPAPYIAHELDREDLHDHEIAAIERGELKPAGARLALELV